MLPYPSGDLHMGHWYNFAPVDAYGRFKRMNGYNVMQPIGFDAFGLPAENAAIKHGVQAHTWTLANIEQMREQLRMMGAQWDWEREIVSCLPDYYKWTQWLFLQFYKNGLAYRTKAPANWCPSCNTTLANEQVLADGTCERCGSVGHSQRDRSMAAAHYEVRRRAAGLLAGGMARKNDDDAAQLDRT